MRPLASEVSILSGEQNVRAELLEVSSRPDFLQCSSVSVAVDDFEFDNKLTSAWLALSGSSSLMSS